MPRTLPSNPSVRFLQLEAKRLLKAHKAGDSACCPTLRYHFRFSRSADEEILGSKISLQEVQHALALDYGFRSWKELKSHADQHTGNALPAPAELQKFFESFAARMGQGFHILRCIKTGISETDDTALSALLQSLGEQVESGKSLAEAMLSHADCLPAPLIAFVSTGETLGELGEYIRKIADMRLAMMGPNMGQHDGMAVIKYVNLILWELFNNDRKRISIRESGPMPTFANHGLEAVDFRHFTSRLKIMVGLDPMTYKEPTTGHTDIRIGGKPARIDVKFDDSAPDACCEIEMQILG